MKITVKARVTDDSITKSVKMIVEYHNYQTYLQSNCKSEDELYSATKQQAERILRRIKQPNPGKEYTLILRGDLVHIQKDSKFEGVYWINTPVYPKSINLRVHTSSNYDLSSSEYTIQECKLIRVSDRWYVFITANTNPNFYGRLLREIRGFYFNLRRQLGKKKVFDTIKDIGHREFLQVNHELHRISKIIIDEALRTNAVIVVGKLKGVRKKINKENKSKRTRRLINNFPYYRLLQYIKYKAEWAGILVLEVGEANTSNTCSICHVRNKRSRETQGLFKCKNKNCRREMNADYNGAMNILRRGLGVLSNLGGFLTYPKNTQFETRVHLL